MEAPNFPNYLLIYLLMKEMKKKKEEKDKKKKKKKKKKHGITTLDNKTRRDKNSYRKIQPNELGEAINEVLPTLGRSKNGNIPKMALYRQLIKQGYVQRSQLSQTSFYRMVRDNELLNLEQSKKLRQSFAMQFANELWQADRRAWMH